MTKEKEIDCNFKIQAEQAKLLMSCLLSDKKNSIKSLSDEAKDALKWIIYNHNHDKTHSALLATDGHKMCTVLIEKKEINKQFEHTMFKFPKISTKDDEILVNLTGSDGECMFVTNVGSSGPLELRRDKLLILTDMSIKDRSELLHIRSYKKINSDVDGYKNKVYTPKFNPQLLPQYCVEMPTQLMYNGDDEEKPMQAVFTNPAYENTTFILMPLRK